MQTTQVVTTLLAATLLAPNIVRGDDQPGEAGASAPKTVRVDLVGDVGFDVSEYLLKARPAATPQSWKALVVDSGREGAYTEVAAAALFKIKKAMDSFNGKSTVKQVKASCNAFENGLTDYWGGHRPGASADEEVRNACRIKFYRWALMRVSDRSAQKFLEDRYFAACGKMPKEWRLSPLVIFQSWATWSDSDEGAGLLGHLIMPMDAEMSEIADVCERKEIQMLRLRRRLADILNAVVEGKPVVARKALSALDGIFTENETVCLTSFGKWKLNRLERAYAAEELSAQRVKILEWLLSRLDDAARRNAVQKKLTAAQKLQKDAGLALEKAQMQPGR